MALALAGVLAAGFDPGPLAAQGAGRDSIQLSGRTVHCKSVRIVTDSRLPSEGAASPGQLFLNPRMLGEQPPTVRLFVFHHECGHHSVGASELGAELSQVCQSFEDAPATPTHPSGRRRCLNLDRCFATATAALRTRPTPMAAAAAPATPAAPGAPAPRLVRGPTLVGTGTLSYAGAVPCPPAAGGKAGASRCP
jgi:hypothetical protein